MYHESLNNMDEFPIVVGRIESCNEFHVIPILKDQITEAQKEISKYLKNDYLRRLHPGSIPVEDVYYLSKHSYKRLFTLVVALKVHTKGYLDVFNVDDSTFETVDISGIRQCPIPMQNFNLSLIVVKLFNIECCKVKCKDPSVVFNRISELMHHKRLYAVIRQFVDDELLVDIYNENITNLVYQELIDEGLLIRTNEALVEQFSPPPTEIEKYDIMEHHDQEFSCLFKYMKKDSTHAMIFPLIDEHVDNMRELEAALDKLMFWNLNKLTEPYLNKLCVVQSIASKKVHRARIISEKYKSSYVRIQYIDENTTHTDSLAFIRQIPPDLMLYKTKLVEVAIHNFPFKKGFEQEMTRDLFLIMKNKTMNVLIRAFDDEGIPIVDFYKQHEHVLIYQKLLDKLTPPPITEVPNEVADQLKYPSSTQSCDEGFLCTFAHMVDPYNVTVYPIIDTGDFKPEKIRATSCGSVNAAYLKQVSNPDFDTYYYVCVPENKYCFLATIINLNCDKTRVKIHLTKFDKFMFAYVKDLYEIPDMQLESIIVTLNFRFDRKFHAIIMSELNDILKNKRINVVVRESKPDMFMVVDMYEVGSRELIYQKLIDMINDKEQEEIEQNESINKENELKQDVNLEEDNLMTFDDVPAEQSFEKQTMKRIFFNEVDVILKPLGVGVFTCLVVEFKSFNNIQLLPLINTIPYDIEPLEVQVEKFQNQRLTVQLYKVKINNDLNLDELEDKFCMFIGDQTLTAVVRDFDVNGVPFVELYGKNPFILVYQDFLDDGSFILTD
ncbi:unnamed protein product [Diamesa tonsa]